MFAGVTDTHAALWHLFDDQRLSAIAAAFIDRGGARAKNCGARHQPRRNRLPDQKGCLPQSAYVDLRNALTDPNHVLMEASFSVVTVESMRLIARGAVPDMPDRIVAARSGISKCRSLVATRVSGHRVCKLSGRGLNFSASG